MAQTINLEDVLDDLTEPWSPRIVAKVNTYDVKVATGVGDHPTHTHDDTDEFFLVLKGTLIIRISGGSDVTVGPGEVFVVPRGTEHQPWAAPNTRFLMFEPRGTVSTGDPETGTTGIEVTT